MGGWIRELPDSETQWLALVPYREPAGPPSSQPVLMCPAEYAPRPLRQATKAFLIDRGSLICRLYSSSSQE